MTGKAGTSAVFVVLSGVAAGRLLRGGAGAAVRAPSWWLYNSWRGVLQLRAGLPEFPGERGSP